MYRTIDEFSRVVARLLEIEIVGEISPSDSLFDEWALDSLQAFQLIIVIEAIAGVDVPPPALPEIFTVGDAYGYYRSLVEPEVI